MMIVGVRTIFVVIVRSAVNSVHVLLFYWVGGEFGFGLCSGGIATLLFAGFRFRGSLVLPLGD
jgi:hypothetical protein